MQLTLFTTFVCCEINDLRIKALFVKIVKDQDKSVVVCVCVLVLVIQKKKTKLTHIAFNPTYPVIIVGDDRYVYTICMYNVAPFSSRYEYLKHPIPKSICCIFEQC